MKITKKVQVNLNNFFLFLKQNKLKTGAVALVFMLFLISTSIYLPRVPGLMGDEGSEGQNVHDLLISKQVHLQGERSYIGVWIDFLRIPFIKTFGYTALALRVPMFIASILFFWTGFFLFRKVFGEIGGLIALITTSFSPIYFAEQRMGWAITLLPLFSVLTVFFFFQRKKWSTLFCGLAAGLGLNTHIIFFSSLIAIIAICIPIALYELFRHYSVSKLKSILEKIFLAAIGFWAGFSIQFANLLLYPADQGEPAKNIGMFLPKLQSLSSFVYPVLSGSVYVARYVGTTLVGNLPQIIVWTLVSFTILGLLFSKKRFSIFAWLLGLTVLTLALMYMIEYFALRYFVILALGFWLIAGAGLGSIFDRFNLKKIGYALSIFVALTLFNFNIQNILVPFLASGGSTKTFDFGTRTESSDALVDIQPLLSCIQGKENIFSDNVHIRNRLQYLANSNKEIKVARGLGVAEYFITYRREDTLARKDEICPLLRNFRVVPYDKNRR